MKILVWQEMLLEHLRGLELGLLIGEAMRLSGGDDYDGALSDRGSWELDAMRYEIVARLWMAGLVIDLDPDFILEGIQPK